MGGGATRTIGASYLRPGVLGLMVACAGCTHAPVALFPEMPDGAMYREAVRDEISEHEYDAKTCYWTTFESPPPTGSVEMGFEVAPDGSVVQARVEKSDFDGKEFGECMVAMAMRLHFPPRTTADNIRFSYPYIFSIPE